MPFDESEDDLVGEDEEGDEDEHPRQEAVELVGVIQ